MKSYTKTLMLETYQIKDLLHQSESTCVYSGLHRKTGQQVVIKEFDLNHRYSGFINEGNLLNRLTMSGIPSILLSHEDDYYNRGFIVMTYCKGQTLEAYVKEKGVLTEKETIKLLKSVLKKLSVLHKAGIVYGDMKAKNLIVSKGKLNYLIDFEYAGPIDTIRLEAFTPQYASPEQWVRGQVDLRTDIYSMGLLTIYMLTASLPILNEKRDAFIQLPDLQSYGVSAQMSEIIYKALSINKASRFDSAMEMLKVLRSVKYARFR